MLIASDPITKLERGRIRPHHMAERHHNQLKSRHPAIRCGHGWALRAIYLLYRCKFSEGFCTWSMTTTLTGALADSSFNPSLLREVPFEWYAKTPSQLTTVRLPQHSRIDGGE
jgi:hypothetical protein